MARKILFEKMFNRSELSELVFCGPSDKDGTYAVVVNCPSCFEDLYIVLTEDEIEELAGALAYAKNEIKNREWEHAN